MAKLLTIFEVTAIQADLLRFIADVRASNTTNPVGLRTPLPIYLVESQTMEKMIENLKMFLDHHTATLEDFETKLQEVEDREQQMLNDLVQQHLKELEEVKAQVSGKVQEVVNNIVEDNI